MMQHTDARSAFHFQSAWPAASDSTKTSLVQDILAYCDLNGLGTLYSPLGSTAVTVMNRSRLFIDPSYLLCWPALGVLIAL